MVVHAHTSIESWRLLFLWRAYRRLLMAPIAYWALPNSIQTASFLTEREKAIAEAKLFRPPPPGLLITNTMSINPKPAVRLRDAAVAYKDRVNWREAFSAFTDPMSYITAIYFSSSTSVIRAFRLRPHFDLRNGLRQYQGSRPLLSTLRSRFHHLHLGLLADRSMADPGPSLYRFNSSLVPSAT